MKQLRPYQVPKAMEAYSIFRRFGIVYIAGEVRTGKTSMSMTVSYLVGAKHVLFLTKKKAIGEWFGYDHERNSGITGDYIDFGFDRHFTMDIVNDESIHTIKDPSKYDLIIHDEHHRAGGFPKPGKYNKIFKALFFNKPQIWLSGTPTPENYSSLYHQFHVSDRSPWLGYGNFYQWAKSYVDIKEKYIGNSRPAKDYSHGIEEKIMADVKKFMVTLSQKEAGFKSNIKEDIRFVQMKPETMMLCKQLLDDEVIELEEGVILGDMPAKLRSKIHQMNSGTVILESGESLILDTTKAEYIRDEFKNNKIAIFYKFSAEFTMLKEVIGDRITDDISEFNSDPNKWIALQVQSGREGTNLSKADFLVNFNIDDAALSYFQGRDRMTTFDREENIVVWIFSVGGIEHKIYRVVTEKKANYTKRYFDRDYERNKIPKKGNNKA